jgi:hypothetical protein
VILLAGALQQRLISRILNQRMLEEVTRPRRATALVEQLVDHQLTETALQHVFLDPRQRADHVIGKLASQHRAQLCHFLKPASPASSFARCSCAVSSGCQPNTRFKCSMIGWNALAV